VSFQAVLFKARTRQFIKEPFNILVIGFCFIFCLINWIKSGISEMVEIHSLAMILFLGNLIIAFLLWLENFKRTSQIILASTLFFEIILLIAIIVA